MPLSDFPALEGFNPTCTSQELIRGTPRFTTCDFCITIAALKLVVFSRPERSMLFKPVIFGFIALGIGMMLCGVYLVWYGGHIFQRDRDARKEEPAEK